MSKMYDALRWAEAKRHKLVSRIQEKPGVFGEMAGLAGKGQPSPPSSNGMPLPGGFLRELGLLRNSLETMFEGKSVRSIMFTSAVSGEGVTTISTYFAKFLGLQGMASTLACEMNGHRPAFSSVFSLNGDSGVTDYFTETCSVGSLVQSAGSEVDIIQLGQKDPAIIQLRLKQAFPRFLEEAHESYETIVIDAPPVISSPETPPMAALVDGCVIVVHAGRTKREVVRRSIETIQNLGGNVLGIVLNRKKYHIPGFLYNRI
jgi:Mrp family chromosome partitioning ATPase